LGSGGSLAGDRFIATAPVEVIMRPTTVGIAAIALVSAWAPVRGDVQPNIQIFRVQDKYASAHFHSERADPTDPSRTILTDVFVTVFDDEGLSPAPGGRQYLEQGW
jgi:hypothetical protein